MNNRKEKLEALRKAGIHSEEELREAIKAQKPINITLMTCPVKGREVNSGSKPA